MPVVGSVDRTTARVGLEPFTAILCFLPVLLDVGDVEHDTFESDRYPAQVIHANEIPKPEGSAPA